MSFGEDNSYENRLRKEWSESYALLRSGVVALYEGIVKVQVGRAWSEKEEGGRSKRQNRKGHFSRAPCVWWR